MKIRSSRLHQLCALAVISTLVCLAGCETSMGPAASDLGQSTHEYDIPSGLSGSDNLLRAVRITWNLPSADISKYRIQRSEQKDGSFMTIAEVSPDPALFIDRGTPDEPLKDSSTYCYRIVALLKTGQTSLFSQVFEGVTAPPPEPPKPIFAHAHTSRGVRLTWEKSPSVEITEYVISRARSAAPADFQEIARTPALTYVDGGTAASELRDSTGYLYRIAAVNRVASQSAPVLFDPVTTLPPPQQVQGLTATGNEIRCVPLSWEQSPETNVVHYVIYRREKKGDEFATLATVQGRTNCRYLDGGSDPGNLADFGTYEYTIRAVNSVTSESADSEVAAATTREEPPRVRELKAAAAQPRNVPLAWQASPDAKVIGYEVWRADATNDFAQIAVVAGRLNTNYVDRGGTQAPDQLGLLRDRATYRYKIVAFNYGYVRSSASETVSAQTKKRPDTPESLQTTKDLPHAVNIAWRGNPEPDIAEYEVQFGSRAEGLEKLMSVPGQAGGKTFSARHSQLATGSEWYYRVKAIDEDRLESDWSGIVAGMARPLPATPTGLKATAVKAGVTVSWDAARQPDTREYAVWKKAGFKWLHVGTTTKREFTFLDTDLARAATVSVSAIDKDNLESPRSDSVEIRASE